MKGDLALAAAAGIREHAFAEHTLKEQYLHSFFYFYFLRERQRGRRDDFCLYCCSVSLVTQQVYRLSTYMAIASLIVCGIIALIGYLFYQQQSTGKSKSQRKLPPGPKPLPILGNLKDFPPNGTAEYQHWIKHKDLYGGISSVTVMGMTLVIIHDKKAAHELLEQTSSKTSGRPTMVMANKLCGYESIVLCQSYNPTFRRCRKYLHQELGTKVSAAQFRGVQETEVNRQLVRVLNEPGK